MDRAARYKTPLLLFPVLLLGLTLRVCEIDRESLWLDEAHTYWTVRSSPADIIKILSKDVHPPLYFLLLHSWVRILGDSDGAIRLFSAVFGVFAIATVFHIGRLLFNERFGLLAALFLALSAFHIQYSQEARSYSLYFFLTSISVYFVLLAHKGNQYGWIGYIVSTALLLYTHNTAALCVAGVMLFYVALEWPWKLSSIIPLVVSASAAFLLYAPWIPKYMSQAIRVKEHFWTSELTVTQTLQTLQWLLFPKTMSSQGWIQYALIVLSLSMLLLSIPALGAAKKRILVAIALLFLIPLGINVIISAAIRNIFIPRVLVPALLPLPFFLATPGLMDRGTLCKKLAVTAMVLTFVLSAVASIDFVRHYSKDPWRQAAEIFQQNYKAGDGLVYLLANSERAFLRYLPVNLHNVPVVAIPREYYSKKVGPPRPQPVNNMRDSAGIAALRDLKSKKACLWLVLHPLDAQPRHETLTTTTLAWLDANYKKSSIWQRKGVALIRYKLQ
jgi:4-amino-4-deoxy-L-arabinose transferase-like glycosyltransferase